MEWFKKNFKTLIYIAFVVPILTVAFVSISHVTKWYGISNPLSWAIYLSVGIEIAALSALAAISARMGKKVYFPFGIVTVIQFIGNVYFAYQYIDIDSKSFRDWVELVDPIISMLGVEQGDYQGHKRFLSFFAGGMLPLISLSFLHMLVKFEEEEKNKISETTNEVTPEEIKPTDQVADQVTDQVADQVTDQVQNKQKEEQDQNTSKEDGDQKDRSNEDQKQEEQIQNDQQDSEKSHTENQEVVEEPVKRNTLTYVK